MERDSFIFWREWYDSVSKMPQKEGYKVLLAICELSLNGNDTALDGWAGSVFDSMRKSIQVSNKRAKAGSTSGYTRGSKLNQNEIKTKSKEEQNDNKQETISISISNSISNRKNVKKERFVPPTREDVKAYFSEKGFTIDPDTFFDYFNESGWIDSNGKPVQNWKQKAITWQSKDKAKPAKKKVEYGAQPQTATTDDIERMKVMIAEMKGEAVNA